MADDPNKCFFSDLIEQHARELNDKPYILYDNDKISFQEFYQMCCQVVNGLAGQGAVPGDGVGILMGNCPEYIAMYYGLPLGGFYSVPINVALKGEGLLYILNNSDIRFLVVDDVLYSKVAELRSRLDRIEKIFIRDTGSRPVPNENEDFEALLTGSKEKPDFKMEIGAIDNLMYTSGTTGRPKAVVFRNRLINFDAFRRMVNFFYNSDDILYSCLPCFHGACISLGAGYAMVGGIPLALDKRFSASGFLDRIRHYGATAYNSIGAMMPILLKQPEKPDDADNPLRLVFTGAAPGHLWEKFSKRFDVTVWEGYTAVDSGGFFTGNYGDAPAGSVGRPRGKVEWKLVDDNQEEVAVGETGELIYQTTGDRARNVEYYKDPEATKDKVRDGWVYSGDLFYADKDGNLYFVDRKTDSMRRRGENISSWEVENIVEKHPDVIECAAFGVKTDLAEDEVMIWVKPVPGTELNLAELMNFCAENMAYYMVPRYVDVVEKIPRTGTMRIRKGEMKDRGVTDRTWDREKEMPELKLQKA